jgi:hypothetical protein
LDAAIQAAITERDYSSATATPRRDMNPALANRLGIDPNRGLTQREVAFLLNGQRADGDNIEVKEKQSATLSLGELFGLDTVVLVNELGEIGLDQQFFAPVETTLICVVKLFLKAGQRVI